jgi:hypothetical protein
LLVIVFSFNRGSLRIQRVESAAMDIRSEIVRLRSGAGAPARAE